MKRKMPFWPTLIATGLGSGFSPVCPGTMGAALATLMWVVASLMTISGVVVMTSGALAMTSGVLAMTFTLLGTWATHRLQPWLGDDPAQVVVDEMVGVWIALAACPLGDWGYALAAFVLFRGFDIFKPLGIRALDRRRGAFWVMADDILAGIYSFVILALVRWVL